MKETGKCLLGRTIYGLMTIRLEIEAQDEGIFTSVKTRFRKNENLLLYNGITKPKGLPGLIVSKIRGSLFYGITVH